MSFKLIPDEGRNDKPIFTKRKIRKAGDTNLLATVLRLLDRFEDEGEDMLVSEMSDLVDALHRCAIMVQNTKQKKLLKKLKKVSRQKIPLN